MAAGVGTLKARGLFGCNTGLKQRDQRSMFPSENGHAFSLLTASNFHGAVSS